MPVLLGTKFLVFLRACSSASAADVAAELWSDSLRAACAGPDESPWEGGVFTLRLTFGEQYPEKPPRVRCAEHAWSSFSGAHTPLLTLSCAPLTAASCRKYSTPTCIATARCASTYFRTTGVAQRAVPLCSFCGAETPRGERPGRHVPSDLRY